jgi:hypothetical protein
MLFKNGVFDKNTEFLRRRWIALFKIMILERSYLHKGKLNR